MSNVHKLPIDSRHKNRLASSKTNKHELLADNEKLKKDFLSKYIFDERKGYRAGIHMKTFKEGAIYEGQLNSQGFRHGKGIFKYRENKDVYFGDWKNDKFDGTGTYIFTKGDRYVGELREGRKSGKGNYSYANGNIYFGHWFNDRKDGKGTFEYANTNERYDGKENGLKGFISL